MIKLELTEKEEYFIEKHMDKARDTFLVGMAQHMDLCSKEGIPEEYKLFMKEATQSYLEVYDFINTLCAKLEIARLKK